MNLRTEILRQTNDGLQVFEDLYPGAYENAMGSKKPFRQGASDKNPSCHMVKSDNEWKLINYGEDGKPVSVFDCYMQEMGITNIKECFYSMVEKYHIDVCLKADINKPSKRQYSDANANEKDGEFAYKEKSHFSAQDLEIWGQKVTADILTKYNYKSLEWYSLVYKERDKDSKLPTGKLKKVTVFSGENYPIFMRECGTFRKIYMPCEVDKARRFFYNGVRPKEYVNGLDEIIAAHRKDEPLSEILICSGERDSMNAAAYGYYPIWFNSETCNILNNELMHTLKEHAERIINIPDIDQTGLKVAYEHAKRFPELYTLILPSKLLSIRDNRGKPRKDLRDYLEIWSSEYEFKAMLNNAVKTEFWSIDDKGNIVINTTNMLWFLKAHGFYKYKDHISQQTKYVRFDNYVVREYEGKEIREYVRNELYNQNVGTKIIEAYLNSKKCTAACFDDMDTVEINFDKATHDSRTFFFQNTALKVTKNSLEYIKNKDIPNYAWQESIIPHNFRRLEPAFKVENGELIFNQLSSNFFKVLINTSRIYWREEYENRSTGIDEVEKEYRQKNHFTIYGERLTQDEKLEQMQHLLNKIYSLGYIIHTYKLPSRARALWLMENKITEEGESSGGSGKSFVISALELIGIINVVTLEGRDKKLTDNNHFMDRVSSNTDLLLVDDANDELDFDRFYTMITNSITINPKGKASFQITFKDAPNVAFTSNFAPPRLDGSTERRLLPMIFSDYYHVKTPDNDYRESYSIRNDFGKELLDFDYSEEEYNQDINFLVDCEQYYLDLAEQGIVKKPPMDIVYKRTEKKAMGDQFKDWADTFFLVNSENLDRFHVKSELYDEYVRYIGIKGKVKTKTNWLKSLRAYVSFNNFEMNMPTLKGYNNGRIIQQIDGKTKEMIYIHDPKNKSPYIKEDKVSDIIDDNVLF